MPDRPSPELGALYQARYALEGVRDGEYVRGDSSLGTSIDDALRLVLAALSSRQQPEGDPHGLREALGTIKDIATAEVQVATGQTEAEVRAASDQTIAWIAGEALERPVLFPPCPDAEVCKTCPAASEDDVCLPHERAGAEEKLRPGDGYLHLYECAKVLDLPGGNPDFKRCGYIAAAAPGHELEPGFCPFDHGEQVRLVPLKAVVVCSDCAVPIMREDCRAPDGRLICDGCSIGYIAATDAEDTERKEHP